MIDPPTGTYTTVDITNNVTTLKPPGLLLVTRGNVINIGNNAKYYELISSWTRQRAEARKGIAFDLGGNGNVKEWCSWPGTQSSMAATNSGTTPPWRVFFRINRST